VTPHSNKFLRLLDDESFLDAQCGGVNLLKDFLAPSSTMSTDTTHIDMCLSFEPYQDFP
jgi:hypothetical protein